MDELAKLVKEMDVLLSVANERLEDYGDDHFHDMKSTINEIVKIAQKQEPLKLYVYGDSITVARNEAQAMLNFVVKSPVLYPLQPIDAVYDAENAVISFDQDHIYEDIWLTVNGKKP